MVKVGIPRALLFYYYYPLWKAFFQELGVEIIVSPPTNKKILEAGLKTAIDEACLPVKLYFGHVISLADKVDYLFVPRIISVEKKNYICPKFMGLPDMLKARLCDLPPLIDTALDLYKPGKEFADFLQEVGKKFTSDNNLLKKAVLAAYQAEEQFQKFLLEGFLVTEIFEGKPLKMLRAAKPNSLHIGLLGHPYNIYDPFISMNLIKKLQEMDISILTGDNVPQQLINDKIRGLPKRPFWSLSSTLMGSALNFFQNKNLDGVIYLTSFGCGPESLIGELVIRWSKKYSHLPLMQLTIDEHTGEAGLITRLEAFIEMIEWRKRNENNLSSYGKCSHSY